MRKVFASMLIFVFLFSFVYSIRLSKERKNRDKIATNSTHKVTNTSEKLTTAGIIFNFDSSTTEPNVGASSTKSGSSFNPFAI